MAVQGTFSFDMPGDAQRAADLKRVKAQATLVLVGSLALFAIAKVLLHVHPAFGFVAAFAEAATIGGLADWYAVVALFKRPLGLPIPHTAIIQSNQHRIADKLGEFIVGPCNRVAIASALSASSQARKQCAWLIAVSVRSATSLRKAGP